MVVNGGGFFLLERYLPRSREGRWRHRGPNLVLTGSLVALNLALDRLALLAGVRPPAPGGGLLGLLALPGWAYLVAVVVALDGVTYLAHLLMHKVPAAWRFHRVHHSDAQVDVTTAFRQHPLESVWRYSFLFVGAAALGASSTSVVVYLAWSALNAQFEHACIALPWRLDSALRVVISTPAMHRVHHSRRQPETDRNYSNIFSFWDRVFGTYRAPQAGESIDCGLDEFDTPATQRTGGLLVLPFES
jgi:sterol desaturase/sphingolipid hydroxylase (fatty acid hydroxylase superfamily)